MELTGHVQNGVIVLDDHVQLPEGAEVRVLTNGHVTKGLIHQHYAPVTNALLDQLQEDEDIEKYGRYFKDSK